MYRSREDASENGGAIANTNAAFTFPTLSTPFDGSFRVASSASDLHIDVMAMTRPGAPTWHSRVRRSLRDGFRKLGRGQCFVQCVQWLQAFR